MNHSDATGVEDGGQSPSVGKTQEMLSFSLGGTRRISSSEGQNRFHGLEIKPEFGHV